MQDNSEKILKELGDLSIKLDRLCRIVEDIANEEDEATQDEEEEPSDEEYVPPKEGLGKRKCQ